MKKKVLLVEDDSSLGQTLQERMSQDHEVVWVKSCSAATNQLTQILGWDLVILDVGLEDGSGFDVAKKISGMKNPPTFMFLTAQADAESRLQGFELGAVEYVPKPFHLKELLLRVENIFARSMASKEIQIGSCTINFATMSVKKADGSIEYPSLSDMKVLKFLIEKSPEAVSRDQIISQVWGEDKFLNTRTVDNTILRLRNLWGSEGEKYIRSVRGLGYQWFKE